MDKEIRSIVRKNALVPKKLTIKNNVRIIDTEKGSFVFKKKGNNRNVDNIYKYLTSRAFDYYPNKIDETDEYEMYEYIEDYNEPIEQKAVDIINFNNNQVKITILLLLLTLTTNIHPPKIAT